MSQKNVLVSGANGNLGKAVVHQFLDKGYRVAGFVHRNSVITHQNYTSHKVDLLNEAEVKTELNEHLTQHQTIDTAVLTAGGFALGNLSNTDLKTLEAQYRLNFETAYTLARPIITQMKQQGHGRLFFIGSEPGLAPEKGQQVLAYALAKSLLFQLAKLLNADTKGTDIHSYVVVPQTIDTPENREAVPNADFKQWQKPEAIADIIYHYATQVPSKVPYIITVSDELAR